MHKYTGFLFVWVLACLAGMTLIQGTYVFLFDTPEKWTITHVLDLSSDDSRAISDYLLDRNASSEFVENIAYIGSFVTHEKEFNNRGFTSRRLNRERLFGEFSELVPPFYVITSPKGEAVFAGNYSSEVNEMTIAHSFYKNKMTRYFPMVGCGGALKAQKAIGKTAFE
ncbi:hypothetical protein BDW_07210 [Bdellovibrio bacteriovorus W]|nr:hypothetical protein BDW_07210 [Bdellovibrio bacteriovorus W]